MPKRQVPTCVKCGSEENLSIYRNFNETIRFICDSCRRSPKNNYRGISTLRPDDQEEWYQKAKIINERLMKKYA